MGSGIGNVQRSHHRRGSIHTYVTKLAKLNMVQYVQTTERMFYVNSHIPVIMTSHCGVHISDATGSDVHFSDATF